MNFNKNFHRGRIWVNFPTCVPDCDSLSLAFLDLFRFSNTSICSTMAFPPLGNSETAVASIFIDLLSNLQRDVPFYCIAYDYSRADWVGLHDHLRDVPLEDIFKLSASAVAIEFWGWVMYISHIISIRSRLTHLHDFQLIVLLP